jgi:hypothetical protein
VLLSELEECRWRTISNPVSCTFSLSLLDLPVNKGVQETGKINTPKTHILVHSLILRRI